MYFIERKGFKCRVCYRRNLFREITLKQTIVFTVDTKGNGIDMVEKSVGRNVVLLKITFIFLDCGPSGVGWGRCRGKVRVTRRSLGSPLGRVGVQCD